MSIRRDDLSAGQKTLRSLGMTVIGVTGLLAAGIAYSYLVGDQGSGWEQVAAAAGLAAAAVALFAMLVDAIDYWVMGRRMTPFSLKMTRSLTFVAMLVAAVLGVVASTPLFFLLMTPALMVYLFGVVRRRPEPIRRPSDAPARRRAGAGSQQRSSGAPRQKRGGKKRK